jgi:hypothetical protein
VWRLIRREHTLLVLETILPFVSGERMTIGDWRKGSMHSLEFFVNGVVVVATIAMKTWTMSYHRVYFDASLGARMDLSFVPPTMSSKTDTLHPQYQERGAGASNHRRALPI